jgi:hypothetical protein
MTPSKPKAALRQVISAPIEKGILSRRSVLISIGVFLVIASVAGILWKRGIGLAATEDTKSHSDNAPPLTPPTKPSYKGTSADIDVALIGLKFPEERSLELSDDPTRNHTLTAKEGFRLGYLRVEITPKRASVKNAPKPQTKVGKESEGGRETGVLAALLDTLGYEEGGYRFMQPFCFIRTDVQDDGWAPSLKAMSKISAISPAGKHVSWVTIPTQEGIVYEIAPIAVGKLSMVTLLITCESNAKRATVRIPGCADIDLPLEEFGDWPEFVPTSPPSSPIPMPRPTSP